MVDVQVDFTGSPIIRPHRSSQDRVSLYAYGGAVRSNEFPNALEIHSIQYTTVIKFDLKEITATLSSFASVLVN